MKNQFHVLNKYTYVLFIILISIAFSCSKSPAESTPKEEEKDYLYHFYFPKIYLTFTTPDASYGIGPVNNLSMTATIKILF